MAEYKGIKGFKVQYLDQDPVPTVAGWSAGNNMNTARNALGGAGIQTAALAFGGNDPGGATTVTEEYDGTSWATSPGSMNTARYLLGSAGIQTAALGFGGYAPGNVANTESYNGSTWTSLNSLNNARYGMGGAGTTVAAFAAGGGVPNKTAVENWDGTSWTAGTALGTAKRVMASAGTQTAGLIAGGFSTAVLSDTEEYDGSTWTAGGSLNGARRNTSGAGTQTAAIVMGGINPPVSPNLLGTTEIYDGTSWTSASNLGTARYDTASAGTTTAALLFGGDIGPGLSAATEEYNVYGEPNTFQNIGQVWYNGTTKALKFTNQSLVGTIATGGNMVAGRANHSAFGTATAGVAAGGFTGTVENATEEYDGTSWTSSGNMGTAQYRGFGGGTQTAGFVASGRVYTPAVAAKPATEEYNGSTWTTGGSLSTARYFGAQGSGTQTAGIATAGQSGPSTNFNATEEYDGTSWTGGGTLPFSGASTPGNGPQTSAIQAGGFTAVSPTTMTNSSNTYDGTSWTAVANINTARGQGGTLGDSSAATLIGGGPPSVSPVSVNIENFDGTTWSANPNSLPAGNIGYNNAGVGTQAAGYVAGGGSSPYATTYEFVGANVKGIKTVTVS